MNNEDTFFGLLRSMAAVVMSSAWSDLLNERKTKAFVGLNRLQQGRRGRLDAKED